MSLAATQMVESIKDCRVSSLLLEIMRTPNWSDQNTTVNVHHSAHVIVGPAVFIQTPSHCIRLRSRVKEADRILVTCRVRAVPHCWWKSFRSC